ncbi:MAG: DUF3606 domain-containing protein [Usitatibacter sp.]
MRPEGDYVDLDSPLVLSDWTRSLGVTVDELVRAVDAVGTSAGKVYDYLWRARQRTFH